MLWCKDRFSHNPHRFATPITSYYLILICIVLLSLTHVSQVQDEAVSLVEAVPADSHLCCPDRSATFDLEHPLHNYLVSDNVLEPRCHASFLEDKSCISK